jgi:hypothetical protein
MCPFSGTLVLGNGHGAVPRFANGEMLSRGVTNAASGASYCSVFYAASRIRVQVDSPA